MRQTAAGTSVVIEAPEGVTVEDLARPVGEERRHLAESDALTRFEEARRGAAGAPTAPSDALADFESALAGQDFTVERRFRLSVPEGERRADAGEPATPPIGETRVRVGVGADEEAVLLVSHGGVLRWILPEATEGDEKEHRRGGGAGERVFRLDYLPEPPPEDAARRGYTDERRFVDFGKMLRDGVEAIVLRFVARVAAKAITQFQERNVRTEFLVVAGEDIAQWQYRTDLEAVGAEARDRARGRGPTEPPRVLYLSHGTFSSVLGTYGHLTASRFGRDFLRKLLSYYDLIIGYDHRTMSQDPLENAIEVLAGLERLFSLEPDTPRPILDAFCYSRGALVFRAVTELLLPHNAWKPEIGKVVFVASTNGGTVLAESQNWRDLAEVYTNAVYYASKAVQLVAPNVSLAAKILSEAVSGVGAFVKALVTAGVDDNLVPGLAAMRPGGDFVQEINRRRADQPPPADVRYYAVTSIFSLDADPGDTALPERVAQFLAGKFTQRLYKNVESDLVVHTSSMTEIDPEAEAAPYIADANVYRFGKTRQVWHTTYFLRRETVDALDRFLFGEARPAETEVPAPAEGETVVAPLALTLRVMETVANARRRIGDAPDGEFVVFTSPPRPGKSSEEPFYGMSLARFAELTADPAVDRATLRAVFKEHGQAPSPAGEDETALAGKWTADGPLPVLLKDGRPVGVLVPREARRRAILERRLGETPKMDEFEESGNPLIVPYELDRPQKFLLHHDSGTSALTRAIKEALADGRVASEASAEAEIAPAEKRDYFARGEMTAEFCVGEVAPVLVTLSREAITPLIPGGAADLVTVNLEDTESVQISVIAPGNCEVVGEDYREVLPPPQGKALTVAFAVRGKSPGEGEVRILLGQRGVTVETMVLTPTVTAAAVAPALLPAKTPFRLDLPPKSDAPLLELTIMEETQGSETRLMYFVRTSGADCARPFAVRSEPLGMPRDQFVEDLYDLMERSRVSTADDHNNLMAELQAVGAEMFQRLIPDELQTFLWENWESLGSIFVLSYEPVIPWEFVHLRDPQRKVALRTDTPQFLGLRGLTRWVDNARYPYALRVRSGKVRHVLPDYARLGTAPGVPRPLPEAVAEVEFLKETFQSSPISPNSTALRLALGEPDLFDLLHFACHGDADRRDIYRSCVLLEGEVRDGTYERDEFWNISVSQGAKFSETNPPVVVMNDCRVGRVGPGLTRMGGFAQAFCQCGAGAFVAPLWSIQDAAARVFIETWYQGLKDGQTLSQAAVNARLRLINDPEHPGWLDTALSYSIYGYPHARVSFGESD